MFLLQCHGLKCTSPAVENVIIGITFDHQTSDTVPKINYCWLNLGSNNSSYIKLWFYYLSLLTFERVCTCTVFTYPVFYVSFFSRYICSLILKLSHNLLYVMYRCFTTFTISLFYSLCMCCTYIVCVCLCFLCSLKKALLELMSLSTRPILNKVCFILLFVTLLHMFCFVSVVFCLIRRGNINLKYITSTAFWMKTVAHILEHCIQIIEY